MKLMIVNSPAGQKEQIERLWDEAKKIDPVTGKRVSTPRITRKEFDEAIQQFYIQHHTLPGSIRFVESPGIKTENILTEVGKVPIIKYVVRQRNSRKRGYDWVHETEDEILAADSKGNIILLGKTKLEKSGKNAGWLVK